MPEFNVQIETTYRPVPETLHGADVLIALSDIDPRGSHYKLMGSILLLAAAVEGFCNTVGPDLFGPDWDRDGTGERLERKPALEKLRLIARKAGVPFDLSDPMWKKIHEVFETRNALIHPRPFVDSISATVDCEEADLDQEADEVAASKWSPLLDVGAARQARDAVVDGLTMLWTGLGREPFALRLHGGRIRSYSRKNVPKESS